jgi:hypothetical protein
LTEIREKFVASGSRVRGPAEGPILKCPACGGIAERESARYCLVCGKFLGEEYQPLDSLRSSYRLQGKAFLLENSGIPEMNDLFEINRNPVSEMAWACFVYSLVPYIGILFVPLTVIIGVVGVGIFVRRPSAGGWKLASASIGLSFFVLGAQVFLWWLLYIIPELGRTI